MSAHAANAEGAGYGGGVSGGAAAAAHAARCSAVSTRRPSGRGVQRRVHGRGPAPPRCPRPGTPSPAAAARAARRAARMSKHRAAPAWRELATQHWRRAASRDRHQRRGACGGPPLDALRELAGRRARAHRALLAAYGQAEAATMCPALARGAGRPRLLKCSHPRAPAEPPRAFPAAEAGGRRRRGERRVLSRASSASAVAAAAERASRAGGPSPDGRAARGGRRRGGGGIRPGPTRAPGRPGGGGAAPFDMGRAIASALAFSGAHAAAFTYAARVPAAVWERPVAVALTAAAAPAKAPAEPAPRRRDGARLRGFNRVQQGSTGYAARAAPRGCGERRVSCHTPQPGGCRVRRALALGMLMPSSQTA